MWNLIVIYHANCIDGFTAAWAVWRNIDHRKDAEFVPASYGDDPPDVKGRDVVVVDFSYPRDVMLKTHDEANSLIVLDHHKTAEDALKDLPFASFDMNRSGAGMAWDDFGKPYNRPWLVSYVEDRDLWRFALPQSKEVNAWIGACQRTSFEAWDALSRTSVTEAAQNGRAVLAYIDRYVSEMSDQARRVKWMGYEVPVVNAPYIGISELAGALAETAPFSVGWFQRADGLYAYSLRSRGDVDVSEIAKTFGGGGHRRSAGFALPHLLEEFR